MKKRGERGKLVTIAMSELYDVIDERLADLKKVNSTFEKRWKNPEPPKNTKSEKGQNALLWWGFLTMQRNTLRDLEVLYHFHRIALTQFELIKNNPKR
jgi:hypothetical protein